jgi:hypothetical protein
LFQRREGEILKRSSILTVLLLAATVAVSHRVYRLWEGGQWDIATPAVRKEAAPIQEPTGESSAPRVGDTKVIIEKNLFDPERGAAQVQEEVSSSAAMQRIQSMVLVGTAIFDSARYAMLQESIATRPGVPRAATASSAVIRLKEGDTFEGFTLSEVHERLVVFARGPSRIEVAMDFSRKAEEPPQAVSPRGLPRPAPAARIPRPQPGAAPMPLPDRSYGRRQ